jgi:hypothetical protein
MSTRTVNVQLGIEFADEIQLATAKWLIFIQQFTV